MAKTKEKKSAKETMKKWFTRKPKAQFPPAHWAAEGATSQIPTKESGEPAAAVEMRSESEAERLEEDKTEERKEEKIGGEVPQTVPSTSSVAIATASASQPATVETTTTTSTTHKPTVFQRLAFLGRRPSTPTSSTSRPSTPPIEGLPTSSDAPTPYPAIPVSEKGEPEAIVVCDTPGSGPSTPSQELPPAPEKDVTASTLAQRISSALYSLPALAGSTSFSSASFAQTVALANPDVLKLLSNPKIMNGKGGAKSVWEALEAAGRQRAVKSGQEEGEGTVMVTAPLGAEGEDQVQVEEGQEVELPDTDGEKAVLLADGKDGTEATVPDGEKGKGKEKARKVRIFVPSKEKISFKATWWGFTIYLPPPVLLILNDTHLTAAKRSAMIFASLQWILQKLPTKGLPPQAAATIKIVRTLIPLLTALGAAISAAWAGIKSFDKGLGVKLSATWLLPLVLIPRAWEEADDYPLGMLGVREGENVQYTGATLPV